MKITLSRNALFTAVQQCQSIVEKRHSTPILANILLMAEDSVLTLTSTDSEVGICHTTTAEVSEHGSITVAAKKLFDIIKELDADKDVHLETGQGFVSIRSGRSRFRVSSLPANDYPALSIESCDSALQLSGSLLSEMISSTSFAMSTDETRKYLTGTLFEVDDQQMLRLVATDGHRLSLSEIHLEQSYEARQCIVPRKAISEIRKLCDVCEGQVELYLGERQIRLVAGANVLTSKLIDARFPVFQDVIPQNHPLHVLLSRHELDQVLRRTLIMANEFTHDVRFVFHDNHLEISAHNTDQEQAEERISVDYQGPEIAIGFNGRYLRDALNAIRTDHVVIELRDELSPILVYGENQRNAKHVVMPMRI